MLVIYKKAFPNELAHIKVLEQSYKSLSQFKIIQAMINVGKAEELYKNDTSCIFLKFLQSHPF